MIKRAPLVTTVVKENCKNNIISALINGAYTLVQYAHLERQQWTFHVEEKAGWTNSGIDSIMPLMFVSSTGRRQMCQDIIA